MTIKSNKFEELVELFFKKIDTSPDYSVHRNVKIAGPDGDRQIDILLEGKIGDLNIRTIIECKDYRGKVTVQKVDELHSKMVDVKAHKAVLVSYKGFSSTAIKKAHRLGIELCTIAEALSDSWAPRIDLPILIEEVTPRLSFNFHVYLEKETTINLEDIAINKISIAEAFHAHWNSISFPEALYTDKQIKDILRITPPYSIEDVHKRSINIQNLELSVVYKKTRYFGNLSTLPNTLILQKIITNDSTILIDANQFLNYRSIFAEYAEDQSLPNELAIKYSCYTKPIIEPQHIKQKFNLKKLDS